MQIKSNILRLNYQIQQFIRTLSLHALAHVLSQGTPVCSVLGKTYANECVLRLQKETLDWSGSQRSQYRQLYRADQYHRSLPLCTSVWKISPIPLAGEVLKCSKEELNQFSYHLLDWFLLLSRVGKSYSPGASSQHCLSHRQRVQLAQVAIVCMSRVSHGATVAGVSVSK